MRTRIGSLFIYLTLAGFDASTLAAQQGVVAGVSSYHLVSSGHAVIIGGYLRKPLNPAVALLGSISVLSDETTLETAGISHTEKMTMVLPEARIEVSGRLGRLLPFAGVGGGLGIGFGRQFGGLTLHATGGARLTLSTRITLTAAVVARAVDPGRGRTLDALIGFELSTSANRAIPPSRKAARILAKADGLDIEEIIGVATPRRTLPAWVSLR